MCGPVKWNYGQIPTLAESGISSSLPQDQTVAPSCSLELVQNKESPLSNPRAERFGPAYSYEEE